MKIKTLKKLNRILILLIISFPNVVFSQRDRVFELQISELDKVILQGKTNNGEKIGDWLEVNYHKGFITFFNKISYYTGNKFYTERYHTNFQLSFKYYGYLNEKNQNILNGKYYAYGDNNNLIWMTEYQNGEILGVFKQFNNDSKVIVEGNKKGGNFDGDYKSYYNNGNIESVGLFINGSKIGEWKYYFQNGDLKSKGNYICGYYNIC